MIKGIKAEKGKDEIEREIKGIIDLGVKVEIEDIKRVRKVGLVIVRINNLEQIKELISEKRKIKERGIKMMI